MASTTSCLLARIPAFEMAESKIQSYGENYKSRSFFLDLTTNFIVVIYFFTCRLQKGANSEEEEEDRENDNDRNGNMNDNLLKHVLQSEQKRKRKSNTTWESSTVKKRKSKV